MPGHEWSEGLVLRAVFEDALQSVQHFALCVQVLLDDHGTAVLADFGISRTIERTCANFAATQLQGTPAYM